MYECVSITIRYILLLIFNPILFSKGKFKYKRLFTDSEFCQRINRFTFIFVMEEKKIYK